MTDDEYLNFLKEGGDLGKFDPNDYKEKKELIAHIEGGIFFTEREKSDVVVNLKLGRGPFDWACVDHSMDPKEWQN